MKSRLPAMTGLEKERADELKRNHGCSACRQLGFIVHADLHHILDVGRRVSHLHTVPLCPWHHRGVILFPFREDQILEVYGPSYAKHRSDFLAEFGTEQEMLDSCNEWLKEIRPELAAALAEKIG